ncbi:MAG: phosphoglycerate kinase [Gammaproteobacteria bacterium]|nr:phosphoglycerate kinase [Gammaproteobacteria bacterium]MCH9743294.1 phosphoglycerate kinase [Gammaproteobacteria bacterium]
MLISMDDVNLANQRVLIREDLNVPMQQGKIRDDSRIQSALPTIKKAIDAGAKVLLMSHLGRPVEGEFNPEFSLAPVAEALTQLLGQTVRLIDSWLEQDCAVNAGEVVLCENVRFLEGEKKNDDALAKQMASRCDVFVMDAFATSHRAQASTVGVARYAPIACAGPLLLAELDALKKALDQPKKPVVAIVGGSKVSSKFHVLNALLDKVDTLIVGGGIANTFLKANGHAIGQSLCEDDWLQQARQLLQDAKQKHVSIPLPVDVAVADHFSESAKATNKSIDAVAEHDMILDVGPQTAASYAALMHDAKTIIWNGPVGVFEFPAFCQGTQALAEAIAESAAFSIAGGGDTLAALAQFDLAGRISYVSTGGGAFLELLEDKTLPAVAILEQRAEHYEFK